MFHFSRCLLWISTWNMMKFHQYLKTEILRYPSKNQTFFLFTSLRCMFFLVFETISTFNTNQNMTLFDDSTTLVWFSVTVSLVMVFQAETCGFCWPQNAGHVAPETRTVYVAGFYGMWKMVAIFSLKNGHVKHGPGWKVPTNLIYSSILVEK